MDFNNDCRQHGYSAQPDFTDCADVEAVGSGNECEVRNAQIEYLKKYNKTNK